MSLGYSENDEIVAAVEGGGTSFVVAVARLRSGSQAPPEVLFLREINSSHDQPQQTLKECAEFFISHKPENGFVALGIAIFGPVGLDPSRNTYGSILGSSPKQPWRNVDFLTPLSKACQGSRYLAVKIETDVNAPAFAEYLLEKDRLSSVAYITAGTGIGVGLVIHGKPVHGRMHPEGGHVPVQPLPGDKFEGYSWGGKSPFRGRHTVEGISSSVALTERLELMAGEKNLPRSQLVALPDDHEVWSHSANALANLCATLLLMTSVEKIVLGGGIMNRPGLIEKVQKHTVVILNGYLELPEDMGTLICKSSYGNDSGLTGALLLAESTFEEHMQGAEPNTKTDHRNAFAVGFVHGLVAGVAAAFCFTIMLSKSKKAVI
jgi:fructokinase